MELSLAKIISLSTISTNFTVKLKISPNTRKLKLLVNSSLSVHSKLAIFLCFKTKRTFVTVRVMQHDPQPGQCSMTIWGPFLHRLPNTGDPSIAYGYPDGNRQHPVGYRSKNKKSESGIYKEKLS